jgi:hypothetical protein
MIVWLLAPLLIFTWTFAGRFFFRIEKRFWSTMVFNRKLKIHAPLLIGTRYSCGTSMTWSCVKNRLKLWILQLLSALFFQIFSSFPSFFPSLHFTIALTLGCCDWSILRHPGVFKNIKNLVDRRQGQLGCTAGAKGAGGGGVMDRGNRKYQDSKGGGCVSNTKHCQTSNFSDMVNNPYPSSMSPMKLLPLLPSPPHSSS